MSALTAITKFGELRSALGQLNLASITPDEAMAGLQLVGFSDRETVENFLGAAKQVRLHDDESVLDFITNGGLSRLFKKRKAASPLIVQCIHCRELNFLN